MMNVFIRFTTKSQYNNISDRLIFHAILNPSKAVAAAAAAAAEAAAPNSVTKSTLIHIIVIMGVIFADALVFLSFWITIGFDVFRET
jgi:hypothetical protein